MKANESEESVIQPEIPCSWCGQPMIETRFSRHYVLTCNNRGVSFIPGAPGHQGDSTKSDNRSVTHPTPPLKRKEGKGIEGNRRGYKKRLQKSVTEGYNK